MVLVLVAVTAGNILTDRRHRSTPNPYVTHADRVTAPRPATAMIQASARAG